MKNLIILTILLTIWVGVFPQETINQIINPYSANNKSYHPSGLEDFIELWMDKPQNHVPGLSTCVLRNGELFWVYHSGDANVDEEIPVTDSSCFRIGSISKTVVQTASMQQYELEDFSLYDTINNYLPFNVINPNHPESVITFYQLMTHSSSIKDNWPMMDSASLHQSPLAEFLGGYFTPGGTYNPPTPFYGYAPGAYWNYSNVGSTLLAYLTELMAEQDFNEYCLQNIFNPIGINNASFDLADINASHAVIHYTWNGSGYEEYPYPLDPGPYSYYPAGNLRISAIELSKFLGMYMQEGTFNDSTILNPETIELIHTPSSFIGFDNSLQCLTWFYSEYFDIYNHTGSNASVFTMMAYDKDDQWGVIVLMNSRPSDEEIYEFLINVEYFAMLYNPIAIAYIEINDTDGDQVIEANEEFDMGLTLRNDMNYPDVAENIVATMSVNSPYVNLVSDSVVSLGTLNYLDEIQLPDDQFVFEVGENLEPGNIEFQLKCTWDNGGEHITSFELFAGHADVLLVRDEDSVSVSFTGGLNTIQDYYLRSLDELGYSTHYWDIEERGNPSSEFIENFPVAIWFTGNDEENTISENNQDLLATYLDNGGQLFLSGQNISDELAGTNFLENYLHVEHVQDSWTVNMIYGIANDPIGNGQTYQINSGDALANQYSKSIVDTLPGSNYIFNYSTTSTKGAAIRYSNDTYKTVFFAFGFEAIAGFNNRTEILGRIMEDYFIMPHPCLPEGITFSTQEEIDDFHSNNFNCIEIEGNVIIEGADITNLDGLDGLIAVGGFLKLNNNASLNDVSGLQMLSSVGGEFWIDNNDLLQDLSPLGNIQSIGENTFTGGSMFIVNNDVLQSLTGLENIAAASILDLHIYNNLLLSECDVSSICDYLADPNGTIDIHDNATGCDSQEEVESACFNSVGEQSNGQKFIISPNPFKSKIVINYLLEESTEVTVKLFDLKGLEMAILVDEYQQQGQKHIICNTSNLPAGVYFCVLKTKNVKRTEKVIRLN